jgi:hypothetical protein
MRILGYMEWGNGLAMAGAWASGPTLIQLFGPGIKKPGEIVQDLFMETSTSTSNGTATPMATAATLSITPTSAVNKIRASSAGALFNDAGVNVSSLARIFRNGTVPLGPIGQAFSASGAIISSVFMEAFDAPNSTSPTTYAVFIFQSSATGHAFYPFSGSSPAVNMRVQEIMG